MVEKLVESLGDGTVAEKLGVSRDVVVEAALGRTSLSDLQQAQLWEIGLGLFGSEANMADYMDEPSGLAADSVHDTAPQELLTVEVDLDGDGVGDVTVGVVPAQPGASWRDQQRMMRDGLRRSLEFAQMSRFRVDMSHQEYVSALGIVTRLELGLISWFREAVPDPSEQWDESRRWREIERRIARIRWVSDEEAKEYSGIKGILNRIMGRRKLSGKEMFEKMVSEADGMVQAMRMGETDRDIISDVTSYLGLGNQGPPALPGR